MKEKIISVINQKGGVGKTTTVINLAAGLSLNGKKILVIDLDPQGNATTGLGLSNVADTSKSIYGVLNGKEEIQSSIQKTNFQNLDIVTSNVDLSGLEVETADDENRAYLLKTKLTAYLNNSSHSYDYVLIDCPPSLGLLTLNGLVAAREVLLPIQCEYYALEGLSQLLRTLDMVSSHLNPDLRVSAIVLTMYDGRTRLASQVVHEVRTHFGERVLDTVVPRSVRVSEAPSYGQTVLTYDANSPGSLAYREVAEQLDAIDGQLGNSTIGHADHDANNSI